MIKTTVKKLQETAKLPTYADIGAVGADLYSNEYTTIEPGTRKLVGTGIAVSAHTDRFAYFRIAPRSGLSVKGIDVGAGVVDLSYRGEIKVVLINNSKEVFNISQGDRIAQLIFTYADQCTFEEKIELDSTERGSGGFGSTGK